jgi:Rhodopirellula transposase DDE domain
VSEGIESGLAEVFGLLLPHLDERQRRLTLGAAACVRGHGGIRLAAGAGRRRLRDLDADLLPALLALVEPDQRGDPESALRWTVKSTRALAAKLSRQGHRVGHNTVAALLKDEGFSPQGTSRTTEGARHPDRNAQFHYINDQAETCLADGQRTHRAGPAGRTGTGQPHPQPTQEPAVPTSDTRRLHGRDRTPTRPIHRPDPKAPRSATIPRRAAKPP